MAMTGEWITAHASNESLNQSATWRFRKTITPERKASCPVEVSLSWSYSEPSPELQGRMEELEDNLEALCESDESLLAAVVGTTGLREWIFYTSSYQGFLRALNEALRTAPRYPIKIVWSDDPGWLIFDHRVAPLLESAQFRDHLRGTLK